MKTLVSWKVGGEQGTGIDKTGELLATTCNRLGYYIYGYREFSSRIKGGHSNYKIRIGTRPIGSTSGELNVLVASDQETIDRNVHELVEGGLVIGDEASELVLPEGCKGRLLTLPVGKWADEIGSSLVRNVIFLGVTAYIFNLPIEAFEETIEEIWGRKGDAIVAMNKEALKRGYNYATEHVLERSFQLQPVERKRRLLMIGNEAVALGALAAGCRVMAAYPITPASEIMEWLQKRMPKFGGVVVQAEDEIAAMTICVGAGFAGARAMTATSGPGLSLKQEAIGLAHAAEIPVVIVDTQRGGPSTGMPTKHEQSDVLAMLYGTHGDTPRIVLAPSNAEECFYDTVAAFNLADKYQMPVFLALDLSLALNKQTVEALDYERVVIDRGEIVSQDVLDQLGKDEAFKRYAFTESGISPRSLPGQPKGQYLATGVEHNEYGKVSEDPVNRVRMMEKRFNKLRDFPLPGVRVTGPENPDLLLIGFGSTGGPLAEAREMLEANGIRVAHAQVRVLAPFPTEELARLIASAQNVLVVESNYGAQLAHLIKLHVGDYFNSRPGQEGATLQHLQSITKYDGRPFLPQQIVARAEEVLKHAYAS